MDKYLELQYYFMRNDNIKMGNKIPYTETKIEGILLPAFELTEKKILKDGILNDWLKDLEKELIQIHVEMGGKFPESFRLRNKDFDEVMLWLSMLGNDLEALVQERVKRRLTYAEKSQIVDWCTRVRKLFLKLRKSVKEAGMRSLELFHLNFEKGVLLRSVSGLTPDYGFWGLNYPIISASIFSLSHPYWYCKGQGRNIGLLYTVEQSDDLIAVYPDDSSTIVRENHQELGFYDFLDAFLIDDGVPDAFLQTIYQGYRF